MWPALGGLLLMGRQSKTEPLSSLAFRSRKCPRDVVRHTQQPLGPSKVAGAVQEIGSGEGW